MLHKSKKQKKEGPELSNSVGESQYTSESKQTSTPDQQAPAPKSANQTFQSIREIIHRYNIPNQPFIDLTSEEPDASTKAVTPTMLQASDALKKLLNINSDPTTQILATEDNNSHLKIDTDTQLRQALQNPENISLTELSHSPVLNSVGAKITVKHNNICDYVKSKIRSKDFKDNTGIYSCVENFIYVNSLKKYQDWLSLDIKKWREISHNISYKLDMNEIHDELDWFLVNTPKNELNDTIRRCLSIENIPILNKLFKGYLALIIDYLKFCSTLPQSKNNFFANNSVLRALHNNPTAVDQLITHAKQDEGFLEFLKRNLLSALDKRLTSENSNYILTLLKRLGYSADFVELRKRKGYPKDRANEQNTGAPSSPEYSTLSILQRLVGIAPPAPTEITENKETVPDMMYNTADPAVLATLRRLDEITKSILKPNTSSESTPTSTSNQTFSMYLPEKEDKDRAMTDLQDTNLEDAMTTFIGELEQQKNKIN